jgi:hypothetical protein
MLGSIFSKIVHNNPISFLFLMHKKAGHRPFTKFVGTKLIKKVDNLQ